MESRKIATLKSAISKTIKELEAVRKKIIAGDNSDNVLKQIGELQLRKESLLKRVKNVSAH